MLTIYRRHTRRCGHRKTGRRHHHCRCPIWVQGTLAGEDIRRSTGLQNWQKAHELLRDWEVSGRQPEEQLEIVTVRFACDDGTSGIANYRRKSSLLSIVRRSESVYYVEPGPPSNCRERLLVIAELPVPPCKQQVGQPIRRLKVRAQPHEGVETFERWSALSFAGRGLNHGRK